ncbi:MAG: hypothetical protein ACT4TC_05125 [Myxococcaceae bacterium]
MKRVLAVATFVFAAAAFAETAGGLTWTAPAAWKAGEARPMRAATYEVPSAKGDADKGEVAVFYFGQGQGGGVEQNVDRWISQFEQPDGKPSKDQAKTKKETINGLAVTTVELTGTYTASMGPMGPKSNRPGYKLSGAIVEGPLGAIFFKLIGPAKTVDAAKGDFQKLLKSVKK